MFGHYDSRALVEIPKLLQLIVDCVIQIGVENEDHTKALNRIADALEKLAKDGLYVIPQ